MADSEPSTNSSQSHQILSATYNSPTNARFTHTIELPTPATTAPEDRTTYLCSLKSAVAELQDKINTELTTRMEEDKAREASANESLTSKLKGVDESKEEDNYGEEVVEEE